MASADLRDELLCSICLSIYTDPVTLRCGHNFCWGCIDQFLYTQDGSRVYSCPECRAEFQQRPSLQRNIALHNVAQRLRSSRPLQNVITGIHCTYCIHSHVPAVKSCLHCAASLCDDHLRIHSKEPEHILTDPSISLENKKCSVHKKVLEYYCTDDDTCICASCSLVGDHRGHQVEKLDEASEKKKKILGHVLQLLTTRRKQTEGIVQSLEELCRKAQEQAAGEAERVTTLFKDTRKRLDDLEKRVQTEISRQKDKMSRSLSDVIHKLELKKDKLSRKMRHIEELCNMTDPLIVLQDANKSDLYDPEEGGDEDTGGHDKTDDVNVITRMLHAGFADIITNLQTIPPTKPEEIRPQPASTQSLLIRSLPISTQASPVSSTPYGSDSVIVRTGGTGGRLMAAGQGGIYGQGPVDISLDVNTAANNVHISHDLKTATWTEITQNHPETAERFQYYQVMSRRGFTSGRHYWDVEISSSGRWMVGMCYPSIDRSGGQTGIGNNKKSWSLRSWYHNQYSVIHDSKRTRLPHQISSNRFRICLDYEAGQLSFYELCDPIRHLHTFTATFTEPLHAVLGVYDGSIKILEEQL